MKRWIAIMIALLTLLTAAMPFAQAVSGTFYYSVIDAPRGGIEIYEHPDWNAKNIGKIYNFDVVPTQSYPGAWSLCYYKGRYGYIPTYTINDVNSTYARPGRFEVTNCKKDISLRSWPSTDGNVVTKIPKGTILTECYFADDGFWDWCFVRYNGKYGYVQWKYLKSVYIPGGQ